MKKKIVLSVLMVLFLMPTALMAKEKTGTLVKIYTTMGVMKVKLYDDTPLHKANFLKLVESHFYDGLLFHRVIKDFMIQAGDPKSKTCDSTAHLGDGDVNYTIPAEITYPKHYHKRGALCAARRSDKLNPNRVSSGCQFYIVEGHTYTPDELDALEQKVGGRISARNTFKYSDKMRLTYETFGGTPTLDAQYTVFGELVKGFDVLEAICKLETNKEDRPKKDVRILKMKVVRW